MSIIDSNDKEFRRFRQSFPLLRKSVAYFDSAATTLKPLPVLSAMDAYYKQYSANVHRGNYSWAREATRAYESSRAAIAQYLGVAPKQVVFTSGTTAAINMIATGLEQLIESGDRIVISQQEHHANWVPWVWLAQRTGAILDVVPIHSDGRIDEQAMLSALAKKPKILSVTATSNVVGYKNRTRQWIKQAREQQGTICIVDGAQDVLALSDQGVADHGANFYVFSGHKAFADTGVGVLTGEYEWLSKLTPLMGGGEMITSVSETTISLKPVPARLEAGTPAIAQVISLGAALTWWAQQDRSRLLAHKQALTTELFGMLSKLDNWELLNSPANNQGVICVAPRDANAQDWAYWLDVNDVAVRVGQHCAQPLLKALGQTTVVRISLAPFNTLDEIEHLAKLLADTLGGRDPEPTTISWQALDARSPKEQMQAIIASARSNSDTHYALGDLLDGCESETYLMRCNGEWCGWSRSAVIDGLMQLIVRDANNGIDADQIQRNIDEVGIGRWLSRTRRSGVDAIFTKLLNG